jgi:hypothetical protein
MGKSKYSKTYKNSRQQYTVLNPSFITDTEQLYKNTIISSTTTGMWGRGNPPYDFWKK